MAGHDDDTSSPPRKRDCSDLWIEHRDLHNRVRQMGETTNVALGRQQTDLAVLQQKVADNKEVVAKLEVQHETLRRDIEDRVTDTRKYAATLVDGAKAEAKEMVKELSTQIERQTTQALTRMGIWVAVVSLLVTVIVQVGLFAWAAAHQVKP